MCRIQQLLALLVTHAGHVVTREEIQHALSKDDTFVDHDQGINQCVKRIGKILGDDAETLRFVETVARRGYRFNGWLSEAPDLEARFLDPTLGVSCAEVPRPHHHREATGAGGRRLRVLSHDHDSY